MTLDELEIGEEALVIKVNGESVLRQHFLDMGLIPGAKVKLLKYAPMGDPMEKNFPLEEVLIFYLRK